MATKEHSYKNHPVIYKVLILGQDVSDSVKSIEGIESSLDYPDINEYRVSEASFTLSDPDNNFNPQTAQNFYSENGSGETPPISARGYRAPVTIQAGFIVDEVEQISTIYTGQTLNISKNAKTKDVRIVCSDASQSIRDQLVTDFGLAKKMKVQSSGGSFHGIYPFYSGLVPVSSESVEGNNLIRKNTLRTEGPVDSDNFREFEDRIETEGGPRVEDTFLEIKAPLRSKRIETIIKQLLQKYNITNQDINLPISSSVSPFFSSLGRPGYDTGFNDLCVSNPDIWQWSGVVTDMIGDNTNDVLYLLVSQTGSTITEPETPDPKPIILKWNLKTDTRELLTTIAAGAADVPEEAWRFVANSTFTDFYVLGTQPTYIHSGVGSQIRSGWQFASYNSSEATATIDSAIRIHRITNTQTHLSLIHI